MESQRSSGHAVSQLTSHLVWSTKYRYPVLDGDVKVSCRTILIQICEAEDIVIPIRSRFSRSHSHAYKLSSVSKSE